MVLAGVRSPFTPPGGRRPAGFFCDGKPWRVFITLPMAILASIFGSDGAQLRSVSYCYNEGCEDNAQGGKRMVVIEGNGTISVTEPGRDRGPITERRNICLRRSRPFQSIRKIPYCGYELCLIGWDKVPNVREFLAETRRVTKKPLRLFINKRIPPIDDAPLLRPCRQALRLLAPVCGAPDCK